MASVNKVIIIGNLGKDPDMRYMPSGDAVAKLNIATTEKFKNRSGEMQEATEWHSVEFFGKIAEVCGQYLKKGSQVYVEGSLRTRKWQDKEGNDRWTTDIRGDRMQMLGGRSGGGGTGGIADYDSAPSEGMSSAPQRASAKPAASNAGGMSDMDDDIPF